MIQLNSASKVTAIPVAETITKFLSLKTFKYDLLTVDVAVATQALDQFQIRCKVHKDSAERTLFSTAEQYGAPEDRLKECSGDLTTIAAAGTGFFTLDVSGLHEVNLYAASANTSSDVSAYVSLR